MLQQGRAVAASGGTLLSLILFFLKTGVLVFGSGLAIVPLLRDGVVAQHHWLTQAQFLDAVAMGLITPGPVVITAAFIGCLVGGATGALVATLAIFLPIYVGVIVPGRWFIQHRGNRQVKAFVTGTTAAAGGALYGAVVVLTRQAVIPAMRKMGEALNRPMPGAKRGVSTAAARGRSTTTAKQGGKKATPDGTGQAGHLRRVVAEQPQTRKPTQH